MTSQTTDEKGRPMTYWGGLESQTTDKPDAVAESDIYLLSVIADIRKKTGVGDKPMLSELADTLAGKINCLKSQIEFLDKEIRNGGNNRKH